VPAANVAPREFLGRLLQGVPTTEAEPIAVNGLDGYRAVVRSTTCPGQPGPGRGGRGLFQQPAYIFKATRQAAACELRTGSSLHGEDLPPAAGQRVHGCRARPDPVIQSPVARTSSNWARKSPIKKYPAEQLRLLNDLYPDRNPRLARTQDSGVVRS